MNREYHKWFSKSLQREMELLIFGWSGRAVLFFPTRMARFYDYENWGIVDAMRSQIDAGQVQLFCVDSIDGESFYNEQLHPYNRMERHLQYESYILNEVVPLIKAKNNGDWLETAGCSMGAYHALNLAMKYPRLFKKAVGMSGRYDLTSNPGDFKDLLDGYRNETVYLNMPGQYISNLTDCDMLDALRKLEVIIAVGETDPFLPGNREFSALLGNKGIPNQFHQWESNAHRPHYWRRMVPLYI
ncbi:esterase family protein [Pedobacter africanus]|uniref:Esterase/lipase superfamily enzyme n=1 Tax=Pedobacter africanus TaxID=151894 RepID=A0A1W2AF55_9SPHI|nr:alpha/beta hydrolase-fold protein [Pedobacter africanus]SMC58888.1 Esterase/lipase superfamily enzyme [Pedobacter africanus]